MVVLSTHNICFGWEIKNKKKFIYTCTLILGEWGGGGGGGGLITD